MKKLTNNQQLGLILAIAVTLLGIGAAFYHYIEHLPWLDAFYFCTITLTTIGYGDISPKTDLGKLFTIPYAIMGIGILGAVINTLNQRRLERWKERRQDRFKP
jgi:voltage-gated potassium channel Kch